jgi:hypothetical protein
MPLMVAYYSALYSLAQVILPVNSPEDKVEKLQRFYILAAYSWGFQRPLFSIDGHAWEKPKERISGDFMHKSAVKGLILTKSHQVVGITSGVQFKRTGGPGVVYTDKKERPFQIIDLRSQIRTSEIDVVSKDGISFKAIVLAAFRIDPEDWDEDTTNKIVSLNSNLAGANKPNNVDGSFPFSDLRVQAVMGTTSTDAKGDATIYWDQWALNAVEDAARKIISQKTLDELWRPANDDIDANALDVIAKEMKTNSTMTLRAAGILLLTARIVNFKFSATDDKGDTISRQQIATWGSEWERKRTKILDEAQAESDRTQQEARAYAESLLLNSIAEGLQKTQEMHPHLPRYVIAARFLSSLQEYIHKSPTEGDDSTEKDQRIKGLHNYLRNFQDQFLSSNGKEKS